MTDAKSLVEAELHLRHAQDCLELGTPEGHGEATLRHLYNASRCHQEWARSLAPPPAVKAEANRKEEPVSYHPDPQINAEVATGAAEAERLDLKAGYPSRHWKCPRCRASHARGFFPLGSDNHRCLRCGYQGPLGVLWDPQTEPEPKDEENGEAKLTARPATNETRTEPSGAETAHEGAAAPNRGSAQGVGREAPAIDGRDARCVEDQREGPRAANRASEGAVTAVPEGAMPEVLPPGSRWRCTGGVNIRQGVFINGARRDEGGYRGYSTYLDCEGSVVSAAHEKHIAEHWIDWTHHLSMQDPAAGRTGEEPSDEELSLAFYGAAKGEMYLTNGRRLLFRLGREFERSLTPSRAPGSVGITDEEWEALEACVEGDECSGNQQLARKALRKLKESK